MDEEKREPGASMNFEGKEYLTWQEAMRFMGTGKDVTRRICDEIGATKYFGSRIVRFSKSQIMKYFDAQDFQKAKEARTTEYQRTHADFLRGKAAKSAGKAER